MAWTISAKLSGPGSGTTLRWPRARRPPTSEPLSMPSTGASPAAGTAGALRARAPPPPRRALLHARDRPLAGGVDVGHYHRARVVHAGAELVEQGGEAAV